MHPDGLQNVASDRQLGRKEHTENFPVALKLLPAAHRESLHAVYGYARTVDELGDSYAGDRKAALRAFAIDLDRIWTDGEPEHPVLRRLRPIVRQHDLPADPFHHLIQANLQDQTVTRYRTFEDLIGYCRLSADPVGRMVLGVFDVHDPETERLSDLVCTALQLVEHWQDVAEDRRAGRIYLPQADLATYGVAETDLDQGKATQELRDLMTFETARAEKMLDDGATIVGRLHGWARISVAGFVAGGQATVRALRCTGGDVLAQQAQPSKLDTVRLLVRAVAR
ncbi:squalene synthase HpnC [Kribbella rubisoli]|uniref:Squalene synthase HpnC n=1 Tax=Kribbella rubisoli TaxID=3075929 RepID=A0A4Q7WMP7_9ACTN|nr:squalene synthase HpnC [Kribbella rubisoli]RZU11068.1 squalene synthase HpnC [Kribbella rubisoli]